MNTAVMAPGAFVRAYDQDPLMVLITKDQMLAWLGQPDYEWKVRDDASIRSWRISTSICQRWDAETKAYVTGRWQIECNWDDVIHHTIVGPHSGRTYEIVRHRTSWCGHLIDCWTTRSRRGDGVMCGPSLAYEDSRDQTPAAAEARCLSDDLVVAAHGDPFATREAYEACCASLGVSVLSDGDCQGYGVRYGDFDPWTYNAETRARMALARRRMMALDVEDAARHQAPEPEPIRRPWGAAGIRYDEACEGCRRVTEIDNDTNRCLRCSA